MTSQTNLFEYIKSDLVRYAKYYSLTNVCKYYCLNRSFKYLFWFRLTSSQNSVLRTLASLCHRRLSHRYGIQIPRGTQIGYGLYIGHHMCVVIHPTTKIGNNCNVSQFTTIGSNVGQAATIGDNVYIGPNVCIVEDVAIGDNASIGAGSVVVKDVPDNATVVGVPATVISYKMPGRYVANRYLCTTQGSDQSSG